jgi:hypothetical protein
LRIRGEDDRPPAVIVVEKILEGVLASVNGMVLNSASAWEISIIRLEYCLLLIKERGYQLYSWKEREL